MRICKEGAYERYETGIKWLDSYARKGEELKKIVKMRYFKEGSIR